MPSAKALTPWSPNITLYTDVSRTPLPRLARKEHSSRLTSDDDVINARLTFDPLIFTGRGAQLEKTEEQNNNTILIIKTNFKSSY